MADPIAGVVPQSARENTAILSSYPTTTYESASVFGRVENRSGAPAFCNGSGALQD